MRISITASNENTKPYHRTSKYDDEGYNTGDVVDVYYPNNWCQALVSDTHSIKNKIKVRILKGPQIHDEIEINLLKDASKIKLSVNDNDEENEEYEEKGH